MMMGRGARASAAYQLPTQVLITAMSTPPTQARAQLINDLIFRLIIAGVWAKLDVLWIMAAADAQAAGLNWKNPASFTLTAVNSPTFTANRGYAGNGSTSYLQTGYIPSTNGVNYVLNNGSIGAWTRTIAASTAVLLGTNLDSINPRNASDLINGRLQNLTGTNGAVTNTAAGMKAITRNNSSNFATYSNGAVVDATVTVASSAVATVQFYICGRNSAGGTLTAPTDKEIAAAYVGASLSSTEMANMYSALNAYMVAVGAA